MNKLRIAVVGAGHLGRIHAKLLGQVDDAELVAVCDPFESARQVAAESLGVRTCADPSEIVDQIDAAVIAAPTDLHCDIAKSLLKAGKHLFVEKPLASDSSDAQRLAMLAAARRLTLQVGHVERFNPAFTSLGDLARDVKYVEAVRASSFPGRCLDVGVVMDLMIHDLDLVLSMTDAPVTSVSSSGLSVISDHEDVAETRIEFACGMVANLKASRISPTPARSMQIFGANGFADIDFGKPSVSVVRPADSVVDRTFDLNAETDNPLRYSGELFQTKLRCETLELEPRNAILDELHDFVISIRSGSAPAVDGAAGARAVAVADKVLQSIQQRSWYSDATTAERGPHALVRESIQMASRRAAQDRRAA
ncbi:Gfo/Idh/MocA family oxidoreductase [Crateriforma conspicua]|uniref:Dehydrogenase n=1 Tax=Crateriforma conspicua TaxID=2527996 RepID=A0A5C5Y3S2_9PLAN|nr:Gfo/Idh/MocA family oxidoreductase [Crateriforma conspicua]QDV63140.1 Dehydrogenase [Crateriforma conspicua]TWT68092.1 Dehydrogenase [Crateriforma conspicua]